MSFYLFWSEFKIVGRVEKQSDLIQWRGLVLPCVLYQEVIMWPEESSTQLSDLIRVAPVSDVS